MGDSPPPPSTTDRSSPRRRWPWVVAAVLVLLTVAAVVVVVRAPHFLRKRLEQRLSEALAGPVVVERVDVLWTELMIVAHDVRFDDEVRLEVDIERVEVHLSWDDLTGDLEPVLSIHHPHVTLEAKPGPDRPPREGKGLEQFEAIEILDGELEVVIETSRGPTYIDISEIDLHLRPNDLATQNAELDLEFEVYGRLGEAGRLSADGRTSSRKPAETWSFRFEVERFDLATLNWLWLDLLEMDVDHGALSLAGQLTRTPGHLRGGIRPNFEDLSLLGAHEDALHPMAEALFGHMLMGSSSTIPIDRPMTVDSNTSLPELLETDWRTIVRDVIRSGYARRLNKIEGFTARIGDVGVDFSQGLLQLFDVVVDTQHPIIDIPLIQIDRVDVVFDPAVTVPDAAAYKHVTLWRPTLTFTTGSDESDNRIQFDETWIDKISAIPFATRDLIVHDGRLDIWDVRNDEPLNVHVGGIEMVGEEMALGLHPVGVRGARLHGTGMILDEGYASIHVVYEPRSVDPNLDLDLQVDPLSLTALAPALQTYAGVDAIGGKVGLTAHISARNYAVEATVVPEVRQPQLRSMGGRGLRKLVLKRALRHLKSHTIDLHYTLSAGDGVLHEFFPELIKAVFMDR